MARRSCDLPPAGRAGMIAASAGHGWPRERQMPAARDSDRHGASRLSARLRSDFDLAILISFGALAAVVIAGFAVFRFYSGNMIGGLANCAIVAALSAVLVYALRGGDTGRAATVFVLVTGLACIASSLVFGRTAVYWGYLVLWINFVLSQRQLAIAVNLAMVGALAAQGSLFDSGAERAIYLVTALLVTAYGWTFSSRYASQRRQLEILASHDPLTGAGNRRLLQHDLEMAIAATGSGAAPSVLAVLDLDHFKQVNDRHGHEVGDRVLVRLVEIARERLRKTDGLYRFGGEEFVVLLAHVGLVEARVALADLRERLNAGLGEVADAVTVSIGAAEQVRGEDWSGWLGRADAALYRAKQAGRNRVEVAGDAVDAVVGRRSSDQALPD
jgi:diguanylate cyclase (GGDEF)-like protein